MAYYVKINNPREFRRDILESSKKVIGCLQANRNVQFIRGKKLALMKSLQDQIKELGLLFTKFDGLLPEKELREEAMQRLRQLEEERKLAMQRALEEKRNQEEVARRRAEMESHVILEVGPSLPTRHEERPSKMQQSEPVEVSRPKSEADKLQSALASIEQKLASLE